MSAQCSNCYSIFSNHKWNVNGSGYCSHCVSMHPAIRAMAEKAPEMKVADDAERAQLSALHREWQHGDRAAAIEVASAMPTKKLRRFVQICKANTRDLGRFGCPEREAAEADVAEMEWMLEGAAV